MKKAIHSIIFSGALCIHAAAQDASVFPKGEVSNTDNHTGTVWLSELAQVDSILIWGWRRLRLHQVQSWTGTFIRQASTCL
jgi:hypothetical protein